MPDACRVKVSDAVRQQLGRQMTGYGPAAFEAKRSPGQFFGETRQITCLPSGTSSIASAALIITAFETPRLRPV